MEIQYLWSPYFQSKPYIRSASLNSIYIISYTLIVS